MPDIEMDEEQLVGAVTHLIGDKQVLIYMEQALNKVIGSKKKLAALEDSIRDAEARLKQANTEVLHLDQVKAAKLAEIDKYVEMYRRENLAKVDKDVAELRRVKELALHDIDEEKEATEAQVAGLVETCDALQAKLDSLSQRISVEEGKLTTTIQARERAEAELARVTKLIEEIKRKV